jgi:hypothetical protein
MLLISGFILLCIIVVGVYTTERNKSKRKKELKEFSDKLSNHFNHFTPTENAEVNQEVEITEKVAEHEAVGHNMATNSIAPLGVNSAIGAKALSSSDKTKKVYKKDKDKS